MHMDEGQAILGTSDLMGANCTSFAQIPRTETQDGDVQFYGDLTLHPEAPRFTSLNGSTWDYWLFYAVSDDGKTGYSTSLFRDGSGPARGGTNFRYMMEILLSDGSTHTSADFFDQAEIQLCDNETVKGVWSNVDEQGLIKNSISFEFKGKDVTEVQFTVDLPDVKGKLDFRTRSTPIFASGGTYPPVGEKDKDVANAALAPGMWWETPMPAADVNADIQVSDKEHLVFTGRGGHDRIWSTLTWLQLARSWIFIRTTVGPYAISLCQVVSAATGGKRYQVANLQLDGKVVFSSRSDDVSITEDHTIIRPTYDGNLKGKWRDSFTGYVLDMVSPAQKKHWHFDIKHDLLWWSSPTGRTGTGNLGFVDRFVGGEVNGEQYEDRGLVSSIEFPW